MRHILFSITALMSCFQLAAAQLPDDPHVYVKGVAEIKVQPDTAIIRVGISEKNKNLKLAKQQVDDVMAKAIKIAKKFNIKQNDIHANQLNIYRQTRYNRESNEDVFAGFQVGRELTLRLSDLDKYSDLLQALVDGGINQVNRTEFIASDNDLLSNKLRKAAIANAKQAAKELTKEFDVSLGDLYSVSFKPDVSHHTPYAVQERKVLMSADSGNVSEAYNTGEISLYEVVYAVYLIK